MYKPHHAAEIRTIEQVEELNSVTRALSLRRLKLPRQVIETFEGPVDCHL
jgi:hypothetical protein